jgi:hypothetical protein
MRAVTFIFRIEAGGNLMEYRNWALSGVLILLMLLMIGCASTPGAPGYVTVSSSNFDSSTQVSMEPAWLWNSPIKLELFWNTKMPDSQLVISALIQGLETFSDGESLQFNIDGEIVGFTSIDEYTEYETVSGYAGGGIYVPPASFSYKRYIVDLDFINHLISAEEVIVRVSLEASYAEGNFSSDAPTTARPAFRKFISKRANVLSKP